MIYIHNVLSVIYDLCYKFLFEVGLNILPEKLVENHGVICGIKKLLTNGEGRICDMKSKIII